MVGKKYEKYFVELDFKDGPGLYRQVTEVSGAAYDLDFHVRYGTYLAAGQMGMESYGQHKHHFNQVNFWLGTDTDNIGDLGAEVELCLGEEREKHMITYEIDSQGIAVVTFNNQEESLNILSFEAFQRFSELFDEIAGLTPTPVGMVLISGKDDNFIVGADIKAFTFESAEQAEVASGAGQEIWGKIAQLPFPTVAAINGTCMGGGLELALSTDIIAATPKAVMAFPETGIGIYPGLGGTQRTSRFTGKELAKYLIFTGRQISAQEALDIGLVDYVFSPDEIDDKILSLISEGNLSSQVCK